MPTLDWLNRKQSEEVVNNLPLHLLKFEKNYGESNENLIIQGDNLLALKALRSAYSGRVKCIFIDPPYNTQTAFKHYDDKLEHAQWLSLIYPRLQLLRELLAEDGSIWITLDDFEAHYMKVICDEVFERKNFIANAIWQKKFSPQNDATWLSDNHDHILIYAKNKKLWRPNPLPRTEKMNARYNNPDNDPKGSWTSSDLTVKTYNAEYDYPITTPSGRIVYPTNGRCWNTSYENMKIAIDKNEVWFGENGNNVPRGKTYLSEVKDGVTSLTIWLYDEVGSNQDAKKEVKAFNSNDVFDTPKPEKLIQKILTLATNENDLVLDSFLGSGTTVAVAHKMNRRYIGIEIGEHAKTHVIPRLEKVIEGEKGGVSVTKEYYELAEETLAGLDLNIEDIKVFAKVLKEIGVETDLIDKNTLKILKKVSKTKKIKSDVVWKGGGGFGFYTLGSTVFDENGNLNQDVTFSDLAHFVWWQRNKFSLEKDNFDSPYLGTHNGVAYYLLYNGILGDKRPNGGNVLTMPILKHILSTHPHDGKKVIWGEASRIGDNNLERENIEFIQIPYKLNQ